MKTYSQMSHEDRSKKLMCFDASVKSEAVEDVQTELVAIFQRRSFGPSWNRIHLAVREANLELECNSALLSSCNIEDFYNLEVSGGIQVKSDTINQSGEVSIDAKVLGAGVKVKGDSVKSPGNALKSESYRYERKIGETSVVQTDRVLNIFFRKIYESQFDLKYFLGAKVASVVFRLFDPMPLSLTIRLRLDDVRWYDATGKEISSVKAFFLFLFLSKFSGEDFCALCRTDEISFNLDGSR